MILCDRVAIRVARSQQKMELLLLRLRTRSQRTPKQRHTAKHSSMRVRPRKTSKLLNCESPCCTDIFTFTSARKQSKSFFPSLLYGVLTQYCQ